MSDTLQRFADRYLSAGRGYPRTATLAILTVAAAVAVAVVFW